MAMTDDSKRFEFEQDFKATRDWFSTLRADSPITTGRISLFPICGGRIASTPPYRVLAEAISRSEVTIAEAPQAAVPILHVINKGSLPVFILDGEEVIGGMQNRIVNTSLLLPANSVVQVPVTCVEHGRWRESTAEFTCGEAGYPTLRQEKLQQVSAAFERNSRPDADQAAIWEEVAFCQERLGVRSSTGKMDDGYRHFEDEIHRAEREVPHPPEGALGVAVTIGGRFVSADIFDQPLTLNSYWRRLVRSYSFEALISRPGPPVQESPGEFLRRLLTARFDPFPSPGLGVDLRFRGNEITGASLVYDRVAIHTSLFPQQFNHKEPDIERPGRRAGRRLL